MPTASSPSTPTDLLRQALETERGAQQLMQRAVIAERERGTTWELRASGLGERCLGGVGAPAGVQTGGDAEGVGNEEGDSRDNRSASLPPPSGPGAAYPLATGKY
ncbi:hypothetical protein AB0D04_22085 [Streptomyces sp. NPDC048483]|uniref:hypothetical protein n=1 Tax=Streptomyces sp. NPDC048483 TaxID=3154927 RepID=UPI00344156D0